MSFLVIAAAALTLGQGGDSKRDQRSWTISAEWVYTAVGEPLEDGIVTVSDGKIGSVSKGGASSGELQCTAITPGMIDLSVRIDRGAFSLEQSREVTPELRVAETLDVFDEAWRREARSGVTTAMVNAPDRNVVGGLSVALKTAGANSIAARTVKADAVLYGAIGSAPSAGNRAAFGRPEDFYARRPTTRMGVEWEWRKALYDAAAARSDASKARPGTKELQAALDGRLPLMIQAWATQDIRTAIFLKEEMQQQGLGQPRLIIDAAAEAWREPELLVRSGAAVVLPPFASQGRTNDGAFQAWETPQLLDSLGVLFALSGQGALAPGERLAYQPGLAMRGGLSFDAALKSVTINPARMVGIDKRVGSLEAGKDADLVLWNGQPFEPSSSVIGVLIDGHLILDPRTQTK